MHLNSLSSPALISISTVCASNNILALLLRTCGGGSPDSINLEWYHHMKCWKTFCDEGKIRRQQRKEEKGEVTSSKDPTSTEVLPAEVEPPCHKETRMCSQRYVLFVGRFWFSLDKVGAV